MTSRKAIDTKAIASSLRDLAKALGYDARHDSIVCGDRGYYQREKLDLDELYDNYWDANYRQLWYSAYYSVPDAVRAQLEPVARAAYDLYSAATRSAAGTKKYLASLPPAGESSISTRLAALRYFDGKKPRKLTRGNVSALIAKDGFR